MNTGFLGSAVATVLTVYGIETHYTSVLYSTTISSLQQYLPFTLLKHCIISYDIHECESCNSTYRLRY